MATGLSAQEVSRRTPADRDRLIDLVRAVSILVVVLGHWVMAAVVLAPDAPAGLRVGNVLAEVTWLQPATWVLQVMPLFFLAAGFTTARALGRPGREASGFVAARMRRVLPPTLVLLAVWFPLAWALPRLGVPEGLVRVASTNAAMVLWFLAVYLLLAVLAPAQYRLHRRAPWALVCVLPPLVLLLDRTQGTGLAALGLLTYPLVFGFCVELGHLYASGRLDRVPRPVWAAAAVGSVLLLVLATGPGPYPVSMIDVGGTDTSNMLPPSICVVLVAVLQLALLMPARRPLRRLLRRPRVWFVTVAVNRVVMTVFLWHLTAFAAVVGLGLVLDVPRPDVGSGPWWALKAVAVLLAALLTLVLVAVFGRVETGASSRRAPGEVAVGIAPIAALAAVAGLTLVAAAGFANPWERGGIALAGITVAAGPGALLVLLAWALLRVPRRRA